MKDTSKTKKQLIEEIESLRQEVVELKKGELKHKRAENEFSNTKEYLEKLTNALPDVIFTVKFPERTHEYLNSSGERILGYNNQECIGKSTRMFYANEYEFIDLGKKLITAIEQGKEIVYTELPFKRKNGEAFPGELTITFLKEDGKVTRIIGIVRDITERKRAQEELRLHSEIMQNMAEGVYLTRTENGIIVYTNPKFEKMFGYRPGEMIGKHVSIVNAPTAKSPEEIAKEIMGILDKTGTWQGEVKNVKKDGTPFWCYATVSVFNHPEHGKVWISVHTDITERKKAEEALQESESRYRALFEEAIDAIFVADVETGIIIDCNESALRLVGKERSEIIGSHQKTLHLPEAGDGKFSSTFLKHRDQLQVETIETTVVTKSGEIKDVAIRASVIELRGKKIMQANFRDITERKRIEESLKQLMHKHQLILDAAGEGIVGLDIEGKFTFANPFAVKTTGYEIEELIGQNLHELIHYKKPDGTPYPDEECPSYETLKKGISKNIRDEIFFKKDGTSFPVRYTSTPIIEEGVIKGAVVTFRDITERKRLEEQFLQAQKMEAVGHLAGGVAHDFNNILTAIIGYGNLLQMKIKEDDPLRAYINQILLSSEKAANLTSGLLAFSRKQIINPKPVNLNDIVKNVEKLLLRLIGEDIELKTLLADKDLIVMADSGQIEQVLMNLATNARDAMPEGGTLTISTEIVELDREYIYTSGFGTNGKYALISVADTGKGIDEKIKGFIFEPFFTTKERERGTGLGLAVVYGIVKQHNGNIDVYSELDKGTTFRIYLPIIEEEVEETKPKVITTPIGGKETILIAEDNVDVRNYTKTCLEEFGYKVIEAVNGEDAINRFMENKDRIELLLLDVIMPKKNGKEVYDAIKKVRPDIKALFMSGYAEDIIHRKGILEEGLNFVLKPISPQELLKRIREILESKK